MGNQKSGTKKQNPLRQSSLMTKIMLNQQQKVIKHLQSQNININQPINQMGDTIMHYAAYKGHKIILKHLIQKKADFSIKNNRGQTPIDNAQPQLRQWLIKNINYTQNQNNIASILFA